MQSKTTYAVFYEDQTYQTLDLTADDYQALANGLVRQDPAVKLSVGVLVLHDIRSVIEQLPTVTENKSANPALTVEESVWANKQQNEEEER